MKRFRGALSWSAWSDRSERLNIHKRVVVISVLIAKSQKLVLCSAAAFGTSSGSLLSLTHDVVRWFPALQFSATVRVWLKSFAILTPSSVQAIDNLNGEICLSQPNEAAMFDLDVAMAPSNPQHAQMAYLSGRPLGVVYPSITTSLFNSAAVRLASDYI